MKYPEFVRKNRPKGTVVKKINNTYYAYYATSKRVAGKSYPVQVVSGIAGIIDINGFHPASGIRVGKDEVFVRECGFTNYMLKFEELYLASCYYRSRKDSSAIFRSLIVYLSPASYLGEDDTVYSSAELTEKFGIAVPNQLTVLEKILEISIEKLEPLKYIFEVKMSGKVFESRLTEAQKNILKELEIEENDIRRH